MMTRKRNRFFAALLALALLFASCGRTVPPAYDETGKENEITESLTAAVPLAAASRTPVGAEADETLSGAVTSFSERFYKEAIKEAKGNVILSPLSLYYALALTANGAMGETKTDFETALGMSVDDVNEYLYTLTNKLARTENSTVSVANSAWANEGTFRLSPDFVKVGEAYYAAEARSVPFNAETVREINAWVSEKTDGMIPNLVDDLDPALILVLINTVLFDGVWETEYEDKDVRTGTFTTAAGSKVSAEFLYSTEYGYFETKGGVGFSKPYKDGYRFVAVLPEGDTDSFIAGADLAGLLKSALESSKKCNVSIPKFEYETTLGLNEVTEKLGLGRIFTGSAELGGLSASGVNDIVVSDILQKAKVILNEHGTKAAAATEITFKNTAFMPETTPEVYLDRPFFFLIADADGIPLFMGTVEDPTK